MRRPRVRRAAAGGRNRLPFTTALWRKRSALDWPFSDFGRAPWTVMSENG
jgi:hypothetical protein